MANGKNAGRLFPDCTNEYGYGKYHSLPAISFGTGRMRSKIVNCRVCGARLKVRKSWRGKISIEEMD